MLDDPALPDVPAQSNGGSGEILALGSLFFGLSTRMPLTPKERMALLNDRALISLLVRLPGETPGDKAAKAPATALDASAA